MEIFIQFDYENRSLDTISWSETSELKEVKEDFIYENNSVIICIFNFITKNFGEIVIILCSKLTEVRIYYRDIFNDSKEISVDLLNTDKNFIEFNDNFIKIIISKMQNSVATLKISIEEGS